MKHPPNLLDYLQIHVTTALRYMYMYVIFILIVLLSHIS